MDPPPLGLRVEWLKFDKQPRSPYVKNHTTFGIDLAKKIVQIAELSRQFQRLNKEI
jgi:hypothetical protein